MRYPLKKKKIVTPSGAAEYGTPEWPMKTSITARARMPVSEAICPGPWPSAGAARIARGMGTSGGRGMGTSESSQTRARPLQAEPRRSRLVADPSGARRRSPFPGSSTFRRDSDPSWRTSNGSLAASTNAPPSSARASIASFPRPRASIPAVITAYTTDVDWKNLRKLPTAGPTCRQHFTDLARALELGPGSS